MLLLAAHGGGVAALCEVSLELMREFPTSEGATHAALHPSKGAIASCHAPGSIRVTEFDTRETLRERSREILRSTREAFYEIYPFKVSTAGERAPPVSATRRTERS